MKILVFDIETVPDIDAGKKIYNLEGLSDQDSVSAMLALRRRKTGHEFLPHYLQKVVAISLVLSHNFQIKVWSLGEENSSEKELIQRFYAGIEKYTPVLVSWNGCGFDLPVLHYRALLHGITASTYWENGENHQQFKWNNYLNRFHYRHLDLMDVLAGYQNKAFAPLDDISQMLGFPGKMDMSGNQVWEQYQQGEITRIRNYCETDVLNTYCVYLRFELMRGVLTPISYEQALTNVREYLQSETDKSHFQEFLQRII